MAARHYSLALGATPSRLSDVYGGTPGAFGALTDIAYRQLLLSASGAPATIGQAASGQSGQYAARVLADGAEAFWRFEENGLSFADSTGHGHTATISGTGGLTYGVPGALGDGSVGIALDGTQDFFGITSLTIGTTFSVEFWFRPATGAGEPLATIIGGASGGDGFYYNYITRKFDLNFGGGTAHLNTTALTVGTLYHVVLSCTAGTFTFYLNGVADGGGVTWPGSINNNRILTRTTGGGANAATLVDEYAFYNSALTAGQIGQHYALRAAPQSLILPVTAGAPPLVLGGYGCGPLKLSNFTAIGVGSTLSILGIPY